MWFVRRVVGKSMSPTLKEGKLVIFSHARDYKKGDVVIAYYHGKEIVKRIQGYEDGRVYLVGDNESHSTDSREYGWLVDRHIRGKLVWPRV
jgi:nickel-type superoxide dismutase maturation protease